MRRLNFVEIKTESVVYGYEDDDPEKCYRNREDYPFEVTFNYKTKNKIFISRLMSRIPVSAEDFNRLRDFGRSLGIIEVEYERNGMMIKEVL